MDLDVFQSIRDSLPLPPHRKCSILSGGGQHKHGVSGTRGNVREVMVSCTASEVSNGCVKVHQGGGS